MSRQHLARLVHDYLQLPGTRPGGRSPDDAFTFLSPIDGHCVAVDWCPVDDTALICAHPLEGCEPDREGVDTGTGEEDEETIDDLGRDNLGQWWLHEDLITGRTTLALRASITTWVLDDFSRALDAFCHRLAGMSAVEAEPRDEACVHEQPAACAAAASPLDLLLLQRA